VEVISRSNTKKNVSRKAALYLKNDASAVWIVYPRKKIVHVLNSGSTTVLGLDDKLPLPLSLPDSVLTVKQIFSITTKTL
jgi:Uma2 family endonuclease